MPVWVGEVDNFLTVRGYCKVGHDQVNFLENRIHNIRLVCQDNDAIIVDKRGWGDGGGGTGADLRILRGGGLGRNSTMGC